MSTQKNLDDLLSRDKFVNTMCQVARSLAKHRKNACYALNGGWGTGKTFVLDLFQKRLEEAQEGRPVEFLIFRYNCWEYDYYEEPLVAIVSAMVDEIKAFEAGLKGSQEQKETIMETLKDAASGMLDAAAQLTEGPMKYLFTATKSVIDGQEIEKPSSYDHYSPFKRILNSLKDDIREITKLQTVIIVVDELDRCLPEYSIKVLERLHHLFDGIDNVQVILAVDKGQLEHVVREIYGEQTNVDRYLAKFIRFELKLSEGSLTQEETLVNARFYAYIGKFDQLPGVISYTNVVQFMRSIFEGIDMRSRIAVLDKCLLLHEMMLEQDDYKNADKMDHSYLCVELLLTLCQHQGIVILRLPDGKDNGAYQYFGAKEDLLTLLHKLPANFALNSEMLRKPSLVLSPEFAKQLAGDNVKKFWPDFIRNLPTGLTALEYAYSEGDATYRGLPPIPGHISALLKYICEEIGRDDPSAHPSLSYASQYLTLLETLS